MKDSKNPLEKIRVSRLKEMVLAAKPFTNDRNDQRKYHYALYGRKTSENLDSLRGARYNSVTNEELRKGGASDSMHKTPYPKSFTNKKANYVANLFFDGEGNLFRSKSTNIYSQKKVQAVTKVLNKQIKDMLFPKKLLKVAKSSFVEDIGIFQVKWRYDSLDMNIFKEIQYLEKQKENNNNKDALIAIDEAIELELEKLAPALSNMKHPSEFNGIDVDIIQPCNFFVDPSVEGELDNADYIYHIRKVRLSKLAALVKLGRISQEAFDCLVEKGKVKGSKTTNKKGKYSYNPEHDPEIDVYEIWEKGLVTLMTVGSEIILDYRRDLYFGLIKYPFVVFINNPSYKGFYGESDFEGIEPTIEATDMMQTNMVKHYKQHIEGRMFIPPAWQTDTVLVKRLQRGDSGVYAVPTVNGFKEDRIPLFDQAVVTANAGLVDQIRTSFEVDSLTATGDMGSNFRTDGTMSAYMETARSSMSFTVMMFKEQLKKLGKIMLALNSLFLTEPEKIVLTDGDPEEFPVYNSDIPLNLDIDIHIKKLLDPETREKLSRMEAELKIGAELGFARTDRMFTEMIAESNVYQKNTELVDFNFMRIMKEEQEAAAAAGKQQPEEHIIGMKALSYGQQQQQSGNAGAGAGAPGGGAQAQATPPGDQSVPSE